MDNIQINPKEIIPIVDGAPEMSKGVFLSKYTDALDSRLSNYLHSGKVPNRSEIKHPFCAKIAQIVTATPPNDRETALLKLRKDWLNNFEMRAKNVIKHNPTILVNNCDHVILPMAEAYLRKAEGNPTGFYAIKPQYDECIALSIATHRPKNLNSEIKNEQ